MDLSFKKAERLSRNSDFLNIYRLGAKRHTKNLIIYSLVDKYSATKAGFVVSKKVRKKAVDRNLIKRRLREIYRHIKPALPCNMQIVFIGKTGVMDAPFCELYEEVKTVVSKLCNWYADIL